MCAPIRKQRRKRHGEKATRRGGFTADAPVHTLRAVVGVADELVRARVATSLSRLETLRVAVDAWLLHRRGADVTQQYTTQLSTIEAVLNHCIAAVGATIPTTATDLETAYDECRLADRRTNWIERIYRYFGDRFDQRDGSDERRRCLQAADEIVWSCWRPCFNDGSASDHRPPLPGAVPLPYLDAVHAPEAFPAGLVPADLAATYADADFVRDHLARLPVPTIRVPVVAIQEPWLLGLLGHEAAHHLQFGAQLGRVFRTLIGDTVTRIDPGAADIWTGWSVEIFADLVSVALLGPWALWPIAELELGGSERMASERPGYPPALVRLRLMERAAIALGLDPDPAWPSAEAAESIHATPAPYADCIEPVVTAALQIGPSGYDLTSWIDLRVGDFTSGGEVSHWRRWFAGGPMPATRPSLRAPRLVLAGAIAATADAHRQAEPGRLLILAAIRKQACEQIISLRTPTVRAAGGTSEQTRDLDSLGAALASATAEQLDGANHAPMTATA
jgi:hypothetical protein